MSLSFTHISKFTPSLGLPSSLPPHKYKQLSASKCGSFRQWLTKPTNQPSPTNIIFFKIPITKLNKYSKPP